MLWQYYRDESVLIYANVITIFIGNDASDLFNSKEKITGQTGNDDTKENEITLPSKIINNFLRTFKMLPINFEINVFLAWSRKLCYII